MRVYHVYETSQDPEPITYTGFDRNIFNSTRVIIVDDETELYLYAIDDDAGLTNLVAYLQRFKPQAQIVGGYTYSPLWAAGVEVPEALIRNESAEYEAEG